MSLGGTGSYRELDALPGLVQRAVDAAVDLDFELCVRPEIGRLLAVLAGGVPPGGIVGETGTGTGAGLAWMVDAADPSVRFLSYELDERLAGAARGVFAGRDNVEIRAGDSAALFDHGPFDLLVHDGGPGSAKRPGDRPVDPAAVLRAGATMTVDDFTPATTWPPTFRGRPDVARLHWFDRPDLHCTEIRVAPDLAVLVARYLPGDG